MSKRFWIATFGNWLGLPLALFAMALILVQSRFAVLAGLLLYVVGYGTRRFMDVMEEEYRIKDQSHGG